MLLQSSPQRFLIFLTSAVSSSLQPHYLTWIQHKNPVTISGVNLHFSPLHKLKLDVLFRERDFQQQLGKGKQESSCWCEQVSWTLSKCSGSAKEHPRRLSGMKLPKEDGWRPNKYLKPLERTERCTWKIGRVWYQKDIKKPYCGWKARVQKEDQPAQDSCLSCCYSYLGRTEEL